MTLFFGLVDAAGRMVVAAQEEVGGTPAADQQVVVPMPVPAGAYRLRVVAADAAGQIGSVETPVSADLTRAGDLELSDLLVTVAGGSGEQFLAAEEIPAVTERLTVVLELHLRGAMPAGVTVGLAPGTPQQIKLRNTGRCATIRHGDGRAAADRRQAPPGDR